MEIKLLILLIIIIFEKNDSTDPVGYLYKYGHLTSMTYVDDYAMTRAVKEFQKSAGLPQTGKLDNRTRKMMELPRCGMGHSSAKIIPRFSSNTWTKNYLTYKIRNRTESITESQIKKVFENAIKQWTRGVKLTINESNTDQANLNVYFKNIDEAEALGFAYPPENGNIYLNLSEDLTILPFLSSKVYVGWVMAHELGHAMGLEHKNTKRSIMYPFYNTQTLGPSMVDINNLVALYGGQPGLNNDIICVKMAVDAMLYINEYHILIKDGYYWSFTMEGLQGGPFFVEELFPKAPEIIDAAFSMGNLTFLFRNNIYYRFVNRKFVKKKTIKAGFDYLPSNIDAAFYDPKRRNAHFFKSDKYYRFDMKIKKDRLVVNGTQISEYWDGIPQDLEAVTMVEVNKVLFVKTPNCYVFDMDVNRVIRRFNCVQDLFKCTND